MKRIPAPFALLAFAAVTFLSSASYGDEKLPFPLFFEETFENGDGGWEPSDPKAWKIREGKQGNVYSQFVKQSKFQPPFRSPFNISLLKEVHVGDFVLDVQVLSTHPDYGHRDACIVFGYQDPAHFYYVHLGKEADPHANQIFIVNGAPRTKISLTTTDGTPWDDEWHRVRIVRNLEDGGIEVYFDDLKKPAMTAKDKTFGKGRVGLGTFDDTSDWDNLKIYAPKP